MRWSFFKRVVWCGQMELPLEMEVGDRTAEGLVSDAELFVLSQKQARPASWPQPRFHEGNL